MQIAIDRCKQKAFEPDEFQSRAELSEHVAAISRLSAQEIAQLARRDRLAILNFLACCNYYHNRLAQVRSAVPPQRLCLFLAIMQFAA